MKDYVKQLEDTIQNLQDRLASVIEENDNLQKLKPYIVKHDIMTYHYRIGNATIAYIFNNGVNGWTLKLGSWSKRHINSLEDCKIILETWLASGGMSDDQ